MRTSHQYEASMSMKLSLSVTSKQSKMPLQREYQGWSDILEWVCKTGMYNWTFNNSSVAAPLNGKTWEISSWSE